MFAGRVAVDVPEMNLGSKHQKHDSEILDIGESFGGHLRSGVRLVVDGIALIVVNLVRCIVAGFFVA